MEKSYKLAEIREDGTLKPKLDKVKEILEKFPTPFSHDINPIELSFKLKSSNSVLNLFSKSLSYHILSYFPKN